MLFKLLKYDFKSMFRIFLPLWGVILLVSLSNYAIATDPFSGSGTVATIIITALLIAVFTITVVLVIQRFYNGLLKDEGYLMFTLPVHSWQLVLSKYLTALTIVLLSSMVAGLSIFLLTTKGWLNQYMLEQFLGAFTGDALLLMVLMIASTLLNMMATIALVYLSIAVGHLFHKHRIPISIATYIAISTLVSRATEVLFTQKMTEAAYDQFSSTYSWLTLSDVLIEAGAYYILAFTLLLSVLYLGLTVVILDKRLNLE